MKRLNELVKKYSYQIEYNQEDNIFIGRCAELPGLAAHGDTQEEAFKEIKTAVLGTLKWIRNDKAPLPEPFGLHKYSGKFGLRISSEKHRKIATEASLQGISINQFIANKL